MLDDLASRRVTVMGLGRFGGGVGVTRWLTAQGARVTVTDLQPAEKIAEPLADIADLVQQGTVELRLGGHDEADFTGTDLLVANPAVPTPWRNPFIGAALRAGVPVTTEMRLLTERVNRNRVIGITGSAGKSTTTAMIHHILIRSGVRAHLGGNIGGSLLGRLADIRPDDWIVLELSSAMLYWLGQDIGYVGAAGWSPHVAVLTNINPNHIDWHGDFEHYRQSKLNIFRFQHAHDRRIDEQSVAAIGPVSLKIPGAHNQVNARTAIAAARLAANLTVETAAASLADFPGLPHRLQLVAEHGGMRFYNDSKSTTPQATILAVRAFEDPSRVHLIAGGYDKQIDLSGISSLAGELGGLYTIGTTGPTLVQHASAGHRECVETLDRAVECALQRMRPGHVLLLSPGCASWDQFINYEARGEQFTRAVEQARTSRAHAHQA